MRAAAAPRLALLAGLAFAGGCTPEVLAEKTLFRGDGAWTATRFSHVERLDLYPGYLDPRVYEEDLSGMEFTFGEEAGTTFGLSGSFYRWGEIRLLDGHIVPFDWDISGGNDLAAGAGEVVLWMQLYEDVGSMGAGGWSADPAMIVAPTVRLRFYAAPSLGSEEEIIVELRER